MKPKETLKFTGGGIAPVEYRTEYKGDVWHIWYRYGTMCIKCNDQQIFRESIGEIGCGYWDKAKTELYLEIIGYAIVEGKFPHNMFDPETIEIPLYHPGNPPVFSHMVEIPVCDGKATTRGIRILEREQAILNQK